ncbi:MAG: hypothetical protein HWN80_13895 [Candidatus Lokiarchaeota archaeon]|nr:hypothetical protein [Candidatus Lokiarchaeota archaeon]
MIQEIIILNDKGVPIFFHNFSGSSDKNSDYHLIASYFDQICRFTKYGFKESLNTLKMNKSVFYFYTDPKSNFHLILKCESKVDNKKLKKKLIDNIAVRVFDKFLAKFKKELINFNGNFSQFKSFSFEIDEIVKSKGFLRNLEGNPEVI